MSVFFTPYTVFYNADITHVFDPLMLKSLGMFEVWNFSKSDLNIEVYFRLELHSSHFRVIRLLLCSYVSQQNANT